MTRLLPEGAEQVVHEAAAVLVDRVRTGGVREHDEHEQHPAPYKEALLAAHRFLRSGRGFDVGVSGSEVISACKVARSSLLNRSAIDTP
jgi:hypothetical protein